MTLTVRNKLIVLAALAMGGIALVAGSSQVEMARVYTAASFASEDTLPAMIDLGEAETALTAQRIKFWQILAQTDPAVVTKMRQEIQTAREAIAVAFKHYEKSLASDRDGSLLAADRAALEAYYPMIDKALALAGENHKIEARDYVMQNQALAYGPAVALEAHRTYNRDLGTAGAADAARIKSTASYIAIGIGLVVSVLVLLVAFFVIRSLTRALDQAVRVLAEIERGNYDSAVTIAAHDETGKVLSSLETMQRSLKERTEQDRARAESDRARIEGELAAAAENVRIRIALDRVSVGVMLADNDGKIIYTNDFGTGIFRLRATDIRTQLPQFDAERIVGSSFDSFHRVPSHQRNMLAGLRGTHTADIKMGDATLRVIANPVVDAAGTRLGTVVQWIDRTQEIAIEEEVEQIVGEAVDGNLTARIREEGKEGFFKTLAGGVNRLIGSTAEVMRTITNAASEVGTGAEEISRGNADLSQRTEQQASSLEETAASMEQMTAAVKNNADNAAQANQLARAARDQAEHGGSVVQSAVLAMSEINASSRKIADIIGVIDDIAFQTNLLALNAAVEAARAGEQGRGFAVVASEVRNLASRSAAAAKEIKGLIQESVAKVDDGTKLVDASGKVLNDIVAGVKKVTDVVAEIAASSQEQASGIEQVNKAVMSMDEGTQQNAALVEQATAAAQSLNQQAANLTQMMARFQVGAAGFSPESVRASTGSAKAPPAHKASPMKAHSPERRGPNRAFAKAPAKAASTSTAAAPRADASSAGASGAGADADWQQF